MTVSSEELGHALLAADAQISKVANGSETGELIGI